jgi:hypothetical protein
VRFTFQKAEAAGGLPVIAEIPDFRIAQIEGRNGIGKTLALRLLELATGSQPYLERPAAWRSLRENLVRGGDDEFILIRAESEDAADTIEWRLRPAKWPKEPSAVEGTWLGDITLGGHRADLAAVKQRVSFERLSGDEDLTETIARAIDRDRELTRQAAQLYDARVRPLDELLTRIAHLLDAASADELPSAEASVNSAQASLRQQLELLNAALGHAQPYQDALRTKTLLGQVESAVPTLDAEIDSLAKRLEKLARSIETGEHDLEAARAKAEREMDLVEGIKTAEMSVVRASRRLERIRIDADEIAQELSIDADANLPEQIALERRRLDALEATIRDIELGPRLRDVADQLDHVLEKAAASGLDAQVIAEPEAGDALTVAELRTAVARRAAEVGIAPTTLETANITSLIASIHQRLSRLRQLGEARASVAAAQESLARAAQRHAKLAASLSGDAAQRYERIRSSLEGTRREHSEASVRRAVLLRQRAELGQGMTVEDLRGTWLSIQRNLVPEGSTLEAVIESLTTEQDRLQREVQQARQHAEEAQRRWSTLRSAIGAVTHALTAAEYSFVHGAFPEEMPRPDLADSENAVRISRFQRRVEAVRSSVQALGASVLPALLGGLDILAATVRGKRPVVITPELQDALRVRYEAEFSRHLASPEVAEALFENGHFERLDLATATVSWVDAEAQLHTRPLEAFSSGEKAFAYTLARVLRSRPEQAHRVVALDEFGAYVDRDRYSQLVSFIGLRVLGNTADQIVVVLPLRSDTERSLPASERERLATHSYIAREAAPNR